MDRASTFSDPQVIALLAERFVPVALDVWYEQRRQDPAGDFYRKVVLQREGASLERTTQGFYLFTADGALLRAWNNRDPARVLRFLREAAAASAAGDLAPISSHTDARFARDLPPGAVVVETFARVLDARYEDEGDRWARAAREAIGRDHLWVLEDELAALRAGRFPERLARRIARFHLLDDTRGEPWPWPASAVRALRLDATPDVHGLRVSGRVELEDDHEGGRAYAADVLGWIAFGDDGSLVRFDLAAVGAARGASTYTRNHAPIGDFTLGVATRLSRTATRVPPQHARDLRGYLTAR